MSPVYCFFIIVIERAQYRADIHDMELVEYYFLDLLKSTVKSVGNKLSNIN